MDKPEPRRMFSSWRKRPNIFLPYRLQRILQKQVCTESRSIRKGFRCQRIGLHAANADLRFFSILRQGCRLRPHLSASTVICCGKAEPAWRPPRMRSGKRPFGSSSRTNLCENLTVKKEKSLSNNMIVRLLGSSSAV